MDYGQASQNTQGIGLSGADQIFFTSGAGTNDDGRNTFESENNLDLTNAASSWGDVSTRPENHRSIGNAAIFSPNSQSTQIDSNENLQNLGEIMDVDPLLPPTAQSSAQDWNPNIVRFDSKAILTEGDHVSKSTLREVDLATAKLGQDGNIADFYSEIRDMMEANLDNSYNRKLAAWN